MTAINWLLSQSKYGTSPDNVIVRKSKAIFICSNCSAHIDRAINSRKELIDPYICHSCKMKMASDKISKASKKSWDSGKMEAVRNNLKTLARENWGDEEYIANHKQGMINASDKIRSNCKNRWTDEERAKHSIRMKEAVTDQSRMKISDSNKAMWKDPNWRFKVIESIKSTWQNKPDFKPHIINSELARTISKSRWTNNEYRNKMHALFTSAKYKSNISDIMKEHYHNNPESLDEMSKRSRVLWNDPKYVEKWNKSRPEAIRKIKEKWLDEDYRRKHAEARASQSRKPSSIQRILYSILDDLKVEYKPEYPVGFYTFDCYIPKHKILIECQGEYWHSLPGRKGRDKAKATYINKYFTDFKLYELWEHEFYCQDRIRSVVERWLGINEIIDFEFSDVTIKQVDKNEAKLFVSKYHYAGNLSSRHLYGAFLSNELIAVVSFNPPVRKETGLSLSTDYKRVIELNRFCIHPSYQKKNFASWAISHTIKMLSKSEAYDFAVSFADETYNHSGIIYKACGWKHDGEVVPDYWYVDSSGFVMHKKTLWNRAKKMGIKEKEYANQNGYMRIFGREKHRFVLDLRR